MAHPLITRRSLVRALGVVGAGGLLGAVAACGAGFSNRTPSAPASTADAFGTAPRPADTLSPLDLASVPAYDYRAHDVAVVSQGESMDGHLYVPDTDTGVRKAWLHTLHGDKSHAFSSTRARPCP